MLGKLWKLCPYCKRKGVSYFRFRNYNVPFFKDWGWYCVECKRYICKMSDELDKIEVKNGRRKKN